MLMSRPISVLSWNSTPACKPFRALNHLLFEQNWNAEGQQTPISG